MLQPKKRGAPRARKALVVEEPAPKKKKKSDVLVALAMALDFKHNSKIVLACVGAKDRRWDGITRPISKAWLPEVACGYPKGTHKKTIGTCMFRNAELSKDGVYTLHKIAYEPGIQGKHTKKTGEKVYYRKVEESDVKAIKQALPDLDW